MENLNWLCILVGALVPMVMGMIWYSPALFGKPWMNSINKTEEDLKKSNMPVILGISFVLSCLVAYYITMLVGYHGPEEQTFLHGGFHAVMFCVMIALPVLITNSLFEQKSWTNIGINAVYWLVTFGLMGGVIGLLY